MRPSCERGGAPGLPWNRKKAPTSLGFAAWAAIALLASCGAQDDDTSDADGWVPAEEGPCHEVHDGGVQTIVCDDGPTDDSRLELGGGGAGGAAGGATTGPRHVILMIGDGMHLEHEMAGSRFLYGKDNGLEWHEFPYQNHATTWGVTTYNSYANQRLAADFDPDRGFVPALGYDILQAGELPCPLLELKCVARYFDVDGEGTGLFATDSAAAATALATGYKTSHGNIAWAPGDAADGALTSLAESLRQERGMAIGVVSTVPFTHATPAAFLSHNVARTNYSEIGLEIVDSTRPDVLISGGYGTLYLEGAIERLESDAEVELVVRGETAGGAALLDAAQRARESGRRLAGVFGGALGNFEYRELRGESGAPVLLPGNELDPTLAEASLAALSVLSEDDDGFFLLVEQGDIDWASHANNYARLVGGVLDLDEAVRQVVEFVERPGDGVSWENTLLLVTADHATGYLRRSESAELGAGDLPEQNALDCGVDGETSCEYPGGEVGFGTTHHTNELVTVAAMGMGQGRDELFGIYEGLLYPDTRLLDNTSLYSIMMRAGGM